MTPICPPDIPDAPPPLEPPKPPEESAELELEDSDRRRVRRENRTGSRALRIPLSLPPLTAGGVGASQ